MSLRPLATHLGYRTTYTFGKYALSIYIFLTANPKIFLFTVSQKFAFTELVVFPFYCLTCVKPFGQPSTSFGQ